MLVFFIFLSLRVDLAIALLALRAIETNTILQCDLCHACQPIALTHYHRDILCQLERTLGRFNLELNGLFLSFLDFHELIQQRNDLLHVVNAAVSLQHRVASRFPGFEFFV
jgi:hypothetical protein